MISSEVNYHAKEADLAADGKHVRIITRYGGRFGDRRHPRHIETLTKEQAHGLRDSLDEVLQDL